MGEQYTRYQVIVGDPTYLILSVHRRRWETKFTPIDPGILGIGAFLYGGPAMTLMGNTSIMALFHFVWGILLPAEQRDSGIESAGGMLSAATIVASFPVVYSISLGQMSRFTPIPSGHFRRASTSSSFSKTASRCRWRILGSQTTPTTSIVATFRARALSSVDKAKSFRSHRSFNDLKNRIFFAVMRQIQPEPLYRLGGSLHELFDRSCLYRKLPLFSCRAADCFVICYNTDDVAELQVRLSLLDCLQAKSNDRAMTISICTSQHNASFATCDGKKCPTFEPKTSSSMCIHTTRHGGKWIA
ncbi:hypothetical protein AC1031_015007 [Aphanomyces cochlioides]|nr:hypothetical protein AC1031_015007 [Aphanomyces cochlioides]